MKEDIEDVEEDEVEADSETDGGSVPEDDDASDTEVLGAEAKKGVWGLCRVGNKKITMTTGRGKKKKEHTVTVKAVFMNRIIKPRV